MGSDIDIAIVGGGVVGCAAALRLCGKYEGIFLFEKNPGITQGENQSSRNSGVIHSGIYYDPETRPQKARLCVEGNRMLQEFCSRYKVPAINTGKLIVATGPEEEGVLDLYLKRGLRNGVPEVKRITGAEVTALEPNVRARSGLLIPTAGIVDPTSLVYRLYTLASNSGVTFLSGTRVLEIEPRRDLSRLILSYRDGQKDEVNARVVINAGGVEADRLARVCDPKSPYVLDPVRGESYKFYGHKRPGLKLRGMNIYPTPTCVITPQGRHFTVGIHLTPTFQDLSYPALVGSTVTVGPSLVPVHDRDSWQEAPSPPEIFVERVSSFFPEIRVDDLIWHQAGLQARLNGYPDFVIISDSIQPNVIHLLGIDSPGLTSCLAIAGVVGEMVEDLDLITPLCKKGFFRF